VIERLPELTCSEPVEVLPVALPLKAKRKATATPKPSSKGRAVKVVKASIVHPPVILEYDDLQDTVPHPGCLALLDGCVGLSFKGLRVPITIKLSSGEYECQPGTFQPLSMSQAHQRYILKLLMIWQAWQSLIESEQDAAIGDETIATIRDFLNREYDEFVAACGLINDNKSLLRFEGISDPRLGLLLALETFDDESKEWFKADCFTERTSFPQCQEQGQIYFHEDISERVSLAYALVMGECNGIDLDRISELTGLTTTEAEQELVDCGLAVRAPIPGLGDFA